MTLRAARGLAPAMTRPRAGAGRTAWQLRAAGRPGAGPCTVGSMTRRIFSFDEPDRFVAGTVGDPGARTFFLQARDGGRVVSIVLEKTQVAVMAERLTALLDELARHGLEVPAAGTPEDQGPLDEPVAEAFRAGTLSLTWDGER